MENPEEAVFLYTDLPGANEINNKFNVIEVCMKNITLVGRKKKATHSPTPRITA